jgi:hypothetical protein
MRRLPLNPVSVWLLPLKLNTVLSLVLVIMAASYPAANAQGASDTASLPRADGTGQASAAKKAQVSAMTQAWPRENPATAKIPGPPQRSKRKPAVTSRRSIPPPPPISSIPPAAGRAARLKSLIPGQSDISGRGDQAGRSVDFYPTARGLTPATQQHSAQLPPTKRPR